MKLKRTMQVSLLAAIIIASVFAVLLFNLNSLVPYLVPQLRDLVRDRTSLELDFSQLQVSLLPAPQIEITDLKLSNPAHLKAASDTSLSETPLIKKATLQASYSAVLRGRLGIEEIKIGGASLNIVKNARGEFSVSGIPLSSRTSPEQTTTPSVDNNKAPKTIPNSQANGSSQSSGRESDSAKNLSFEIKQITLEGVNLSYTDESKSPADPLTLHNLKGSLKNISFPFYGVGSFSASLFSNEKPNIFLKGEFGVPQANRKLSADVKIANLSAVDLVKALKPYLQKVNSVIAQGETNATFALEVADAKWKLDSTIDLSPAEIFIPDILNKRDRGSVLKVDTKMHGMLLSSAVQVSSVLSFDKEQLELGLNMPGDYAVSGISWQMKTKSLNLSSLVSTIPLVSPYNPSGNVTLDLSGNIFAGKIVPPLMGRVVYENISFVLPENTPGSVAQGALPKEERRAPIYGLSGEIGLSPDALVLKNTSIVVGGNRIQLSGEQKAPPAGELALLAKSDVIRLGDLLESYKLRVPALEKGEVSGLQIKFHGSEPMSANRKILVEGDFDSLIGSFIPVGRTTGVLYTDVDRLEVKSFTSNIASGILYFKGQLKLDKLQEFNIDASARGIDSEILLKPFVTNVGLKGTLKNANAIFVGSAVTPASTVKGNFQAVVVDGEIKGVNVLGSTLGRVAELPIIGEKLLGFIPPDQLPLLKQDSSPFKELSVQVTVANGIADVQSMTLDHASYAVLVNGQVNFNGEGELKGKLLLKQSLAERALAREPKLKLLLDVNRNMVFPVTIKRSDSRILVLPDTRDLTSRAATNTAVDAVGKLLNKIGSGKKPLRF